MVIDLVRQNKPVTLYVFKVISTAPIVSFVTVVVSEDKENVTDF